MPHADGRPHTILLVEDFEDTRELLATELRPRRLSSVLTKGARGR
jgi:hypothetical protein